MKKSPLQQVRDEFGSKEALAEQLLPLLDRREDESDDEFARRIKTTSNGQLLRLQRITSRLKDEFGSKDALIDAIVDKKFGKANADYRAKLSGKSVARLIDMHGSLSK